MTFNSNRKAALAVTAGLVGALTLGGAAVVPAAAYAEEQGIEMQSRPAFTASKLIGAEDGQGNPVDPETTVFPKTKYLVPTRLLTGDGQNIKLDNTYTVTYKVKGVSGVDGKLDANGKPSWNGTYTVTVTQPETNYKWSQDFTVQADSLDGAKLYQVNSDPSDVSDTTFTYTGNYLENTIGVTLDGGKLDPSNYTLEVYNEKKPGDHKVNHVVNAELYTVKLAGKAGTPYAGEVVNIPLTVEKLDLSKLQLNVEDFVYGTPGTPAIKVGNDAINGAVYNFDGDVAASYKGVDGPSKNASTITGLGKYELTLSAKDGNENVVNSGTAEFNVVNAKVSRSSFLYDGDSIYTLLGSAGHLTFDLKKGEAFDASKLSVKESGKSYEFSVSYAKDGAKVDAMSGRGRYQVTVRVKPVNDYKVGGSYTFDVWQTNELNGNETVTFKQDGKVVSGTVTKDYNGSDFLKGITAEVTDDEGNKLSQGSDYTVEVKDASGKVVTSITEPGKYTVTVKSEKYHFTAGTSDLDVEVAKATIKDQTIDSTLYEGVQNATVTYTGSELEVPQVQYLSVGADGKPAYLPLDSSMYRVVNINKGTVPGNSVESMKDAGSYIVTIQLTEKGNGYYTLDNSAESFTVTVKEYSPFEDVAPEAWYAKSVNDAAKLGYVHGAGNTGLFLPGANITRADAIGILFNMAGGEKGFTNDELGYTESFGYDTGFSDVDGNAYYAKALAWAHKYGVANGNGGKFNPSATLTREEFATFLANYAKAKGEDATSDEDALSTLKDGSDVSAWAKESANWAVANKIMGKNGTLDAHNTITRAEVAAMAVSYQPTPVKDPVAPTPSTPVAPKAESEL